jgi:proline-specific peptidase
MTNGSFQLSSESTSIHYSIVGNGEPLLICPVTWGIDGHRWTMLDELAKNFTVIRLDPRGTGGSTPVKEKFEYGIPTLITDIENLRLHLGTDQWNVIGQSAGGWTALEYALAYQHSVKNLIVVCSSPTGKFHKGTFRDPDHPLYSEFEHISKEIRTLPSEERVKKFNQTIYRFDVQTEAGKRIIDDVFSTVEFNAKRNQYFVMTELNRYDVTERLHEINNPSLIIGSTLDVHVSSSWSEMMAQKIPHAQLKMMEKSGHFPWLDEPGEFFESINTFLE